MRSENAMMPSRREFLSDALGIGLVTTSTWSIRDGEARSMYMTRCSSCTPIGSTEVRSGVQCSPSNR